MTQLCFIIYKDIFISINESKSIFLLNILRLPFIAIGVILTAIMQHIGIVANTAEGAALCYTAIVSESLKRFKKNRHPEITLHSYSLDQIDPKEEAGDWDGVAQIVCSSIKKLALTGADFVIMPSNSPHYAIKQIKADSLLPVLSILDVTVQECLDKGYRKIGILGLERTMSGGLYERPLLEAGLIPVVPTENERGIVDRVLWQHVIPGRPTKETTAEVIQVIEALKKRGCDAVILGCTELPIIVTAKNSSLPIIDTTRLLAQKALARAIA